MPTGETAIQRTPAFRLLAVGIDHFAAIIRLEQAITDGLNPFPGDACGGAAHETY